MTARRLLLATAAVFALAGPALAPAAHAQDGDNRRIDQLEKQIRELRAIVFQGRDTGQPVEVKPAGPDPAVTALEQRLGALDDTLRQIKGQLEELEHNVDEARSGASSLHDENGALRAQLDDLKARTARLEGQLAPGGGAGAPPPPAGDIPPPPTAAGAVAATAGRRHRRRPGLRHRPARRSVLGARGSAAPACSRRGRRHPGRRLSRGAGPDHRGRLRRSLQRLPGVPQQVPQREEHAGGLLLAGRERLRAGGLPGRHPRLRPRPEGLAQAALGGRRHRQAGPRAGRDQSPARGLRRPGGVRAPLPPRRLRHREGPRPGRAGPRQLRSLTRATS